jgi:hypothetical protein
MVDFTGGGRGSSGAAPSQFSRNTGPRFGGAPATGSFGSMLGATPAYGGAAGVPGADRSGQNYGFSPLGGAGPAAVPGATQAAWAARNHMAQGANGKWGAAPAVPAPAAPAPAAPATPDATIMPVPAMSDPLPMAPLAPPMPEDPINKYAPVARGPGYHVGAPVRMGYFGGMV